MIYFVKQLRTGYVKIGYTTDFTTRFSALSSEFGEIQLLGWQLGTLNVETELHNLFREYWVEREFFILSPVIKNHIDKHCCKTNPDEIKLPSKPKSRKDFALMARIERLEYEVKKEKRDNQRMDWMEKVQTDRITELTNQVRGISRKFLENVSERFTKTPVSGFSNLGRFSSLQKDYFFIDGVKHYVSSQDLVKMTYAMDMWVESQAEDKAS